MKKQILWSNHEELVVSGLYIWQTESHKTVNVHWTTAFTVIQVNVVKFQSIVSQPLNLTSKYNLSRKQDVLDLQFVTIKRLIFAKDTFYCVL